MTGFGNINDLIKKSSAGSAADSLNSEIVDEDTEKNTELTVTDIEVGAKFVSKMGEIKKKELEMQAKRQAATLGVPYINLERFPISQEALKQIPQEVVKRLRAVCFFVTPDEVRLGAVDPSQAEVSELLHEIEERNHATGGLYLISSVSFERMLGLYATLPVVKPLTKDVAITDAELASVQADVSDFSSLQTMLERKSTTDIVTIVLGAALKLDSSDVHIEAEADRVAVRLRLDGVLHDAATLPKEFYHQLISRLKLLSSLKINVSDKPQDGRFTIKLAAFDVDVRVSTIPTVHGESIVMRLLRQTQTGLTLDDLGVRGRALQTLKREIERPNGMIIATGPTGSGKSTTLYAILQLLNKPGVKIITLEDPVEYRIQGISQSQIDSSHDYTFAKGLRSMLRQDPDIVMVGEIRDLETAEIAVQAALTGHLLLSTIHTNNAAGSIARFLSMGVKPFLLSPALNCVIGQRLVRRLCESCRKKVELSALAQNEREQVQRILDGLPTAEADDVKSKPLMFFQAVGCDKCNNLGYKGRISICEIFSMTTEIETAIAHSQVAESEIASVARKNGMLTMVEDGVLKALDGITTVDEVLRVIE